VVGRVLRDLKKEEKREIYAQNCSFIGDYGLFLLV